MRRLLPLCVVLFALPSVEAVQEAKQPAPPPAEVKAYPTLAPGHHVGKITALVFTPDSKRLITGGEDKTIQVWDVETGKRLRLFRPAVGPGFAGQITALALHPDGKTLAVGAYPIPGPGQKAGRNAAYLLHLDDGRIRPLAVTVPNFTRSVAFSKDGRLVVSGTKFFLFSGLADAWKDTGPLQPAKEFTGNSQWVRSSADGELLLSGMSGPTDSVRVHDAKTGKVTAKLQNTTVTGLAWSGDGNKVLTGHKANDSAALRVWPAAGGAALQEFPIRAILGGEKETRMKVSGIVHRAGSEYFLYCESSRPTAVLFDIETGTGKVLGSYPYDGELGHKAATVSPDGRWGAVPWAPHGQRVALFEFGKPGVRYLNGPAEVNRGAGWTADGKSVTWSRLTPYGKFVEATAGLDVRTLERTARVEGPILRATTSQGGATLKRSGYQVEFTRGDTRFVLPQSGTAITLPGGGPVDWFVVADRFNRGLSQYDAASGKLLRKFAPLGQEIASVASSPDGKHLFALDDLGVGRVYRPDAATPLLSVYTEDADWVAWTEEGYYAASPTGERLLGWTVNSKELTKEANLFPAEQFRATLYRPDVIKLLLDKGSVAEAVKAANATRKEKQIEIPRGVADPEKLLPPNVSLTVDLKAKLVTVTAEQGCVGQPIKSLRLLVDGRPLAGGVARKTYAEGEERETVKLTWPVELPPGKHRLSVLARSKDDTPNVSAPVLVETPLPDKDRPVVHHVAVGVSKYGDGKLDLQYADKDALALSAAVKASCAGTLYREVITSTLTNAKATRPALLTALDDTRKVANSTDLLILSFAGHGVREDGEFYLLTHEADTATGKTLEKTAISGAALREKLADYPCQVLLMLDACHSGAFAPLAKYRPATDEAARALADVEMRVAVMCAAQGHEEALEKDGAGHFTRAIVRALGKDKDVFFDRVTGELNIYHLQAFVYQIVSTETEFKQNPYLKMPLAHPPVIVTRFPMK